MGMSRARAEIVITDLAAEAEHYRRLAAMSHPRGGEEWCARRATEIEEKIAQIVRDMEPARA